ncbi:hypothetical protein HY025_02130 [Candidatus Daviesbacteria bacterium]|nr:hypothetical protein [Candidatus Daviesbacteria bacterium]
MAKSELYRVVPGILNLELDPTSEVTSPRGSVSVEALLQAQRDFYRAYHGGVLRRAGFPVDAGRFPR